MGVGGDLFLARWGWVGMSGDEWGLVGNLSWLGGEFILARWGSVGVCGGEWGSVGISGGRWRWEHGLVWPYYYVFLGIPAMIQSHISNGLIALFSSLASQCFHNSLSALNNRTQ